MFHFDLIKMLTLGIILFVLGPVAFSQYQEHSGCYDCNFAPSGYIKTTEGSTKEVGYVRCALLQAEDFQFVDAPTCSSGRCFLRLEDNGLEYRGCADSVNLPFDVNPNVNCKYQGPGKPLWYFCDGHLCNYGQIGQDEDHCGQSPAPSYYSITSDAGPNEGPGYANEEATTMEHQSQSNGYQPAVVYSADELPVETMDSPNQLEYDEQELPQQENTGYIQDSNHRSDYTTSNYEYSDVSYYDGDGEQTTAQNINPKFHPHVELDLQHPDDFLKHFGFWYFLMPAYWMDYFGYYPYMKETLQNGHSQDHQLPNDSEYTEHDNYPTEELGLEQTTTEYPNALPEDSTSTYKGNGYNPCHGCEDNPSGLYKDLDRDGQFIQCGCAIYDGVPCTCCYPFPMTCPNNTMFNDVSKNCERFGN